MKTTFNKEQLREHLHRDVRLMLAFYLGEKLDLEIPEMHAEVWDELVEVLDQVNSPDFVIGILKKLLAIPREHAKTTLIKLAVILFLRYSRLSFCAYISNTAPVALNALRDVKGWFESPNEEELFGPVRVIKASESEGLYILEIASPIPSSGRKKIMLKAFGQGTQVRGMLVDSERPDLMIFDDIESRETVESELMQKRLDAWALGTAIKAMARRGVCIFIGNMIGSTSLLARLSKDPDWNPTVLGAIIKLKDGTISSLWPSRWSLDALIADYMSYRKIGLGHVWEAELMNLTNEAILGDSLADAWRPAMPLPEEITAGFICLDPAFGLKAWNDDSAITVHVKRKPVWDPESETAVGNEPMLAKLVKGKFTTEQLFDTMLQLSFYWNLNTWVIEAVAAQRLLLPLFRTYLRERGIQESLIVFIPITVVKEAKASRIIAFRDAIKARSYGVAAHEEDFVKKLEDYTPLSKDTDDDLDSGAHGFLSWADHGQLINSLGTMNLAGAVMGDNTGGKSIYDVEERIP